MSQTHYAQLAENRAKLLTDAQALMQGDVTAEVRTKFDAMLVDAEAIQADIERVKKVDALEAETRASVRPPLPKPDAQAAELRSKEESEAFRNFIVGKPEKRDLLTINSAGAALIPQAFYPQVISAQKLWGGVTNIVNNLTTDSGNPMKMALVNDNSLFMVSNTEGQALTQELPVAANQVLSTEELRSGAFKISLDELQDAAFDLPGFVKDVIGKSYYRTLNKFVTLGSGSQIASLEAGYAANAVSTSATGVVTYADILKLYAALEPAYIDNATFVMSSATRIALMGVNDGYGRPLFDTGVNASPFTTILGRPVVINNFMSGVVSGSTAVQFGDFEAAYTLRTVNPGLSVIRLNERYMDQLEVGFIGYARAGGIITNAGIAPVVNLVIA